MKNSKTCMKPSPPRRPLKMLNSTRYIVEVKILDTIGRPKRDRILGVWGDLSKIPYDLIRKANGIKYPGCEIQIDTHVYEGP
jgi:hypothetical protein